MQKDLVVVLDTNIIVSGILNPMGSPGVILRRFRAGDFEVLSSLEQINEISAYAGPDYLVTGDKALRSLLLLMRTVIIGPSEFLGEL